VIGKKEGPTMKRFKFIFITIALTVAAALLVSPAPAQTTEHQKMSKAVSTQSEVDLRNAMRQLWEEHIVYTRNFIISSLGDLEDTGKIAERLLRNQDDIGNAVKPFYGEKAGNKLAALLREHILIAADIVKAAKA
jgi:hypothetical protein